MSAEKKYSERDIVYAQRAAFISGLQHTRGVGLTYEETAARRYPLPKVTRPRVVTLPERAWELPREWRYVDGVFQSRSGIEYPWSNVAQITPNHTSIAALADLLANPTEEVEDDA